MEDNSKSGGSRAASMDAQFATASIPRLLLKLSLPAITAQLINALYNIVDRMYIGRIPETGSMALTGVGLTFPIIMIISAFASLVGMGGAPIASIQMGAGSKGKAEKTLGNCFTMLISISVILTVLFLFAKGPLLYLFGASENTFPYANQYLSIYILGTISVQIALGLNPFISTQGFANISMATVVIGAVTNIILDPIFIFVFGMGVQGAALATILSQTVSAVWVLIFLFGKKTILKIRRENFRIKWRIAGKVLTLGLSPFIMQSTESLVQITFNTSLAHYGNDMYVGAMVIINSIMQIFFMPLTGFTQGAQPIIGYNYGAKNYRRVKTCVRYVLAFCLIFSCSVWLICMFVPGLFTSIFTGDAALREIANPAIRIFFFSIALMGAQVALQNAFIALGQAKYSIFLALLRKIVLLIPLTFLIPRLTTLGTTGVFLAEPISDAIAAISTTILFTVQSKKLLREPASPDA